MKPIYRNLLSAAVVLAIVQAQAQTPPQTQPREAARARNISEAELLATKIGQGVTRLNDTNHAPRDIMRPALDLGTIMALTRSENGVIETTGVASRLKDEEKEADDSERRARELNIAGGYLGGPIDLRFQFPRWRYAFAVVQPGRDGATSRSLQFFDASGNAIHKVYLKNDAGIPVFDKLVAEFRMPVQEAPLQVAAAPLKPAPKADSAIDIKEFHLAWTEMTDVHQFNSIVTEFGLTREQAMRLGPAGTVTRVTPQAVRPLLEGAAKNRVALMAFLGNDGVTQIYSGKIDKVAAAGGFFNVLDPAFNLHLRDTAFRSGYVVRRAGITSVEFYDDRGDLVVTFFGVRERGKPQPQGWIDLATSLPKG
ncbi:MAG: hemin-degrading factor [Pseudomonadota bacterium]|nr:hemin-degrading factor [Pseudomonadota bacterium]